MTAAEPAARLSGVVKRYGDVVALDHLELEVRRGEIVALLGPNGAGKTTAVDIMLGLSRPDEGERELFGAAPNDATASGLVGAMLQDGGLPSHTSVRELVSVVAHLYPHHQPPHEALEQAQVTELADRRVDRLSGGESQRVRLALALLPDPELLVLDEPTTGMDVEARRRFWATMEALAETGRTILFATHYLAEADRHAGRVAVLQRGRVVADSTPDELKSSVRRDRELGGIDLEDAFVALTEGG